MAFKNNVNTGTETHFSAGISGELEFSQMYAAPRHLTTFNGGCIVPIYCREVLPNQGQSQDVNFIIRPTTMKAPVFDDLIIDIYAFFVPNRIVNHSWKSVMGENVYGTWNADPVVLAPLYREAKISGDSASVEAVIKIPVGSVADYYGFPTQQPLPVSVLQASHDLKFRGYIEIYNEYFRDQNYQPPIPYSKLNVYEGFFENMQKLQSYTFNAVRNSEISGASANPIWSKVVPDNDYGSGAVKQAVLGNLSSSAQPGSFDGLMPERIAVVSAPAAEYSQNSVFRAFDEPLKANKLHDYYTSVLPSPQKGEQVFVAANISNGDERISPSSLLPVYPYSSDLSHITNTYPGFSVQSMFRYRGQGVSGAPGQLEQSSNLPNANIATGASSVPNDNSIGITNLAANVGALQASLGISDLRMSAAIQHVYEQLARSGSRYREVVRGFFGIEVDDPFLDVPKRLGHIRRTLDVYQTAQTTPGADGQSPASTLTAFGYTNNGGHLFSDIFYEHGYIHVFAVVRHRNIYGSEFGRDNFRRTMLDFYQPQLANITEQPVYTAQINPFAADSVESTFGYQEAFAEYRYENDIVSGYMRPGIDNSLSLWNYADTFDSGLKIANGEWLKSNTREVLDRSLAFDSSIVPQFKALFVFPIEKSLPMPTYSVGGLDTL